MCVVIDECVLYCRYVAAERYSDALEIYQAGACVQLEHEQVLL